MIVYFLISYLAAGFDNTAEVVAIATETGACGGVVLLFPCIFPLYCRNYARRRKVNRADVCHAGILVYYPYHIHHGDRAFYSGDPGHFLGISADLVDQFSNLFDLFLKGGLDP